jgi:hypothetical protein
MSGTKHGKLTLHNCDTRHRWASYRDSLATRMYVEGRIVLRRKNARGRIAAYAVRKGA